MTKAIWVLDIASNGAIDFARDLAKIEQRIIFSGLISRQSAQGLVEELVSLGSDEACYYQIDVSNKENFELIQSYVIHNFGDFCIAKPLVKK